MSSGRWHFAPAVELIFLPAVILLLHFDRDTENLKDQLEQNSDNSYKAESVSNERKKKDSANMLQSGC